MFSWDSQKLFSGGSEKKVRVFDLGQPENSPELELDGHTKAISNVVALPGTMHLIASSGDERDIHIWDLRTSALVKKLSTPDAVASLEIQPELHTLTAATGKSVQFWDTQRY